MAILVLLRCGVRRSLASGLALGDGLSLWTVGKLREWASLLEKKKQKTVLGLGIAAGLCEAALGSVRWNARGNLLPSRESHHHV